MSAPITLPRRAAHHRLPTDRWGRVWLAAFLLAGVILGGWEGYLRSRGITPSVASRTSVWVLARYRVRATSTVAAGTSRMLTALDPGEWASAFGGPSAIQLSVLGGSSVRLLEHLADSPDFHGLVIADIAPFFTFDTDPAPTRQVDDAVAAYRRAQISPADRIEAILRTWVPSRFDFRRSEFLPGNLLRTELAGFAFPDPATDVRTDGWAPIDFRGAKVKPNTARVLDPASFEHLQSVPPDRPTFQADLGRLAGAVDRLQKRGGTVVLVYMPGCGGRKVLEERRYPKAIYWGEVVAQVPAITIDFEDYPEAATLACFDGSHLDRRDATRFTAWLASEVRARLR